MTKGQSWCYMTRKEETVSGTQQIHWVSLVALVPRHKSEWKIVAIQEKSAMCPDSGPLSYKKTTLAEEREL